MCTCTIGLGEHFPPIHGQAARRPCRLLVHPCEEYGSENWAQIDSGGERFHEFRGTTGQRRRHSRGPRICEVHPVCCCARHLYGFVLVGSRPRLSFMTLSCGRAGRFVAAKGCAAISAPSPRPWDRLARFFGAKQVPWHAYVAPSMPLHASHPKHLNKRGLFRLPSGKSTCCEHGVGQGRACSVVFITDSVRALYRLLIHRGVCGGGWGLDPPAPPTHTPAAKPNAQPLPKPHLRCVGTGPSIIPRVLRCIFLLSVLCCCVLNCVRCCIKWGQFGAFLQFCQPEYSSKPATMSGKEDADKSLLNALYSASPFAPRIVFRPWM